MNSNEIILKLIGGDEIVWKDADDKDLTLSLKNEQQRRLLDFLNGKSPDFLASMSDELFNDIELDPGNRTV